MTQNWSNWFLVELDFRLSQELNNSPEVQNTSPPKPPLLNLKSPRSVRVDDVTDKLADAFAELFRKQWLGALKEKNNGTGHSEKNLIYLADITKVGIIDILILKNNLKQ